MSVFYEKFERHDHAQGLKARTTHYCPGCGHGLVQRYLAEAIEKLGIQDRTVAVGPVGCAVFLYYYLDVGNSQAAHGRAPAVALGHKLANPESIVISYQGDGDLASIGLAEIVSVAQLGIPISVIFINNAIYGMTGGQMAPTTLLGMKTSTTPAGRDVATQGFPFKITELIALLPGSHFVTRQAVHTPTAVRHLKKSIQKALQAQRDKKGYCLIEVVSNCPSGWKMTPREANKWMEQNMFALYPLGDIKVDGAVIGSRFTN